jgi:hypothetical protein
MSNRQQLRIPVFGSALSLLLVVVYLVLCSLAVGGETPQYSNAYFDQLKQERTSRIAQVRQNINLDDIPKWATSICETDSHIIIRRQTSAIYFNRQTAAIDRCTILDVDFTEHCSLAAMQVVDADGTVYQQAHARNANLTVRDEKFYVYLDGSFSPATPQGESAGFTVNVHYKLYKTSGLLTVRAEVVHPDGDRTFRQLLFRNTLGRSDSPLNLSHVQPHSSFHHVRTDIYQPPLPSSNQPTRNVLYEGELLSSLWTDGHVGLQAMALFNTFDQANVAFGPDGYKVVSMWGDAAARYIDFCFLDVAQPQPIPAGTRMEFAVALLPFRKFDGRTFLTQGALAPMFSYDMSRPLTLANETYFKREAARGVDYLHGAGMESRVFVFPNHDTWTANFMRFIETAHRYGLKVYWTLSWEQFETQPLVQLGYFQPDDVQSILATTPTERRDPNATIISGTTESVRFRQTILDSITMALRDYHCDGVYFDLGSIFESTSYRSQIEGNVQLMEDILLLLQSFGQDKVVQYHAQLQISPLEGMVDMTTPGETITGAKYRTLPEALYMTAYNPHLIGTAVLLHDDQSYNLTETDIYKQMYRSGLSYAGGLLVESRLYPPQSDWRWMQREEFTNLLRYTTPFAVFDTSDVALHSFSDPDLSRYASVQYSGSPKAEHGIGAYIHLYSHENGDTLITLTNDPGCRGSAKLTLHLDALNIQSANVLVMDVIHHDVIALQSTDKGTITLENIDLSDEPRAFLIAAVNDKPRIIWRDPQVVWDQLEDVPSDYSDAPGCQIDAHLANPGEFSTAGVWLYTGSRGRPTLNNWTAASIQQWHEQGNTAYVVFQTSPLQVEQDTPFALRSGRLEFLTHH